MPANEEQLLSVEHLERELEETRKGRAEAERDADYPRGTMEMLRDIHPTAAMAVAESKARGATILTHPPQPMPDEVNHVS